MFEFDPLAEELRNGVKLRLNPQAACVLTALLENAGEVVPRDELRKRLWPSDTFVDFEHRLHAAISEVREALGDSATNPRYIRTLSRRGYRFTGELDPALPEAMPVPQGNGFNPPPPEPFSSDAVRPPLLESANSVPFTSAILAGRRHHNHAYSRLARFSVPARAFLSQTLFTSTPDDLSWFPTLPVICSRWRARRI